MPADACRLPSAEQPLRLAEFEDLFATAVTGLDRLDSTRLRLDLSPDPDTASRVAALSVPRPTAAASSPSPSPPPRTPSAWRCRYRRAERACSTAAPGPRLAAQIEARIADLETVAEMLRAALTAGCDDPETCAATPECPLPFPSPGSRP
ncbi:hypothetical protein [Glycomyces salinus]|uniref:hypothetical protein n=1 Tax=Glycomyces salinus TaxID=980294 RepID=UPI0018ED53EB|nr:hypothetical protein [Glycomyces salinus]